MACSQRDDPFSGDDIDQARQCLIQSWNQFLIVEVRQSLVKTAARFADGFALCAYDSMQLPAAHELNLSTGKPLIVACIDRLMQAARLLHLEVLA